MSKISFLFSILLAASLLGGCAASTPLMVAGGSGHKALEHIENKKLRAAAALDEEPDLLTYSLKGIAENRSQDVIDTYLKGYTDSKYSQAIKSLAIYQIGLIYMNRFNEDRDDQKALQYFKRHQIEYPSSVMKHRIEKRIAIIEERQALGHQVSPAELLSRVDAETLLDQPTIPYDEELTPMSERAISTDRIEDAHGVYMVVYENPGSSDTMKAKAMYQMGLIFMSPYNKKASDAKALGFFNRIITEFPNTKVARRAQTRISQIHNQGH